MATRETRRSNGKIALMLGTPQVSSGHHAGIVSFLADFRLGEEASEYLLMNRSLKTVTGRSDLGTYATWRPDVAVVTRTGRVDLYEVQSLTGNLEGLENKLRNMRGALPSANRGRIFLYDRFGQPFRLEGEDLGPPVPLP